MPINCVVGDGHRTQKNAPDLSFYKFPVDISVQRLWVRFVNNTRSDFVRSDYSRVCSAHFNHPRDFEESSLLKRSFGIAKARLLIKKTAVPSVKHPVPVNEAASAPPPPKKSRTAYQKRETERVS